MKDVVNILIATATLTVAYILISELHHHEKTKNSLPVASVNNGASNKQYEVIVAERESEDCMFPNSMLVQFGTPQGFVGDLK